MRLKYLRVNPQSLNQKNSGLCADEMSALLACWRMNGVDAQACVASVAALAACSSSKSKVTTGSQPKSSINGVLQRAFQTYKGA